ncbi:extracellular solute-binding protein [Rhodoligotrophos ferricapiens]|uniref:extracellular solute-binding protein n=1 Tax=Rhodoligotrophos ferricapiens TaxID=3069264 RepID=UPI00315D61F4
MFDRSEQERAALLLRQVLDETRGLSRRQFLGALGKAAAGSALLASFHGMLVSKAQAADAVTTMGWGGEWDQRIAEAYYTPYTEKSGAAVKVIPYSTPKVLAMHEANAMEIDFILGAGLDTPMFVEKGVCQKLDWTVVDKSALTPNQLAYGDYAIGGSTLSYVMAYNKNRWPNGDHPKTWADFWDVEKFPGPRAFGRYTAYPTIEFALLADGVPMDQLYPLDVDRAFRSLDKIKPHIVSWWESGGQQQQMMEDQEVDLLYVWNGRGTVTIRDNGAPFAFEWNQAAYQGEVEAWLAMKGGPNPTGAMQIMNWLGRPEPQAAFARLMYYGPTNLKAYDLLDKELAEILPSYPANLEKQFHIDWGWWAKNYEATQKRFEEWLQA